jgi:hypothetical protein
MKDRVGASGAARHSPIADSPQGSRQANAHGLCRSVASSLRRRLIRGRPHAVAELGPTEASGTPSHSVAIRPITASAPALRSCGGAATVRGSTTPAPAESRRKCLCERRRAGGQISLLARCQPGGKRPTREGSFRACSKCLRTGSADLEKTSRNNYLSKVTLACTTLRFRAKPTAHAADFRSTCITHRSR